jgi:hypothetical protein
MLCKKKSLLNRCECEQQQLNLVILHEQIDNHYIHNHHDDPVDSIEKNVDDQWCVTKTETRTELGVHPKRQLPTLY